MGPVRSSALGQLLLVFLSSCIFLVLSGRVGFVIELLGVVGLSAVGLGAWTSIVTRVAVRRRAVVREVVSISITMILAVAVIAAALLGPRLGAIPPTVLAVAVAWTLWWVQRFARVARRVDAGHDLSPREVRVARQAPQRVQLAAALLRQRHARRAVEVLSDPPALSDEGRDWLVEAQLACGRRDDALRSAASSPGTTAVARARLAILDGDAAAALATLASVEVGHHALFVALARADALVLLGRDGEAWAVMERAAAGARVDVWAYVAATERPASALADARPYR